MASGDFNAASPVGSPAAEEASLLVAFQQKMEMAAQASKRSAELSKIKKKADRFKKQQIWRHHLKRAQRFLGLRSYDWTPAAVVPADQVAGFVGAAAPFPFYGSVVFISVDVEAYERNAKWVTEIGLSTLDTRHLQGVPPRDERGSGWMEKIGHRHLRVKEYGHLRNQQFVKGWPEHFGFGTSEWVSLRDAPGVVAKHFTDVAAAAGPALLIPNDDDDNDDGSGRGRASASADPKIVLVGHAIDHDIDYLQKIGFNPLTHPAFLATLDTAILWRAVKREANNRGLEMVLYHLGLAGQHFHNAGNDAAYTMHAMIGLTLMGHLQSKEAIRAEKQAKAEAFIRDAAERAMEEVEGWSSSGGEGVGQGQIDGHVGRIDHHRPGKGSGEFMHQLDGTNDVSASPFRIKPTPPPPPTNPPPHAHPRPPKSARAKFSPSPSTTTTTTPTTTTPTTTKKWPANNYHGSAVFKPKSKNKAKGKNKDKAADVVSADGAVRESMSSMPTPPFRSLAVPLRDRWPIRYRQDDDQPADDGVSALQRSRGPRPGPRPGPRHVGPPPTDALMTSSRRSFYTVDHAAFPPHLRAYNIRRERDRDRVQPGDGRMSTLEPEPAELELDRVERTRFMRAPALSYSHHDTPTPTPPSPLSPSPSSSWQAPPPQPPPLSSASGDEPGDARSWRS
ncbi:MAG: hypothetical protein M1826_005575 [Phylliscum demangeonii]|nr:MAG: hypothetical protein M1826_005575 [Phylliscum demangeonii]